MYRKADGLVTVFCDLDRHAKTMTADCVSSLGLGDVTRRPVVLGSETNTT